MERNIIHKLATLPKLWRYTKRATGPLARFLRRSKSDILHIQCPTHVELGGAAAAASGTHCVWEMPTVVGDWYPLKINRWLYHWRCWKYGITVLANSAFTADSLGSLLVKPIVFHLGVDPQRFNSGAPISVTRASLGIPARATVLGVVARVEANKGQHVALDAMLELLGKRDDLFLVIVGGPADGATDCAFMRELRQRADTQGRLDRLIMLGPKDRPECFFGLFDIFVQPSVVPEAFGLSTVEAMMMGVPALVHALGGPAETVIDGVTGWHFNEPTAIALAGALERALADRYRWPEIGQAGHKRAMLHFTIGAEADRYELVIRSLTSSANGRLPNRKLNCLH